MIYVAPDGPGEYKAGAEAGAACQAHLTPPSIGPVAKASVECCGGEVLDIPLVVSWNDSVFTPARRPRAST